MAYISVNETARQLNRSVEQVRRYLREGKLRGQRIGGHWFVDEDAVAALRGNARRIGEPGATYEVSRERKPRKTAVSERKISEGMLRRISERREEIRRKHGEFDAVKMLRESRNSH